MKDHEIALVVNELRAIAVTFRDADQLRSRIASVIVPLLKSRPTPEQFGEARDAGSLTLKQRADISRAAGVLEANDSYFEAGKLRAILATAPRDDTAMLEWLIEKQAWIQWENRDGSILQCQVYDQDEDEEYHILSGEGRYFNTPRDAIRAAMDRSALGEK